MIEKGVGKRVLGYLVLTIALIWIIFPLIWIFLTSIKTTAQAFSLPPIWLFRPIIENYQSAIKDGFLQNILNSTIVAVTSVLLAIGLGAPAAYAFSRFRFPGRRDLQFFILSLYFVPAITQLLPFLVIWRRMHLLGSFIPTIVMHTLMNLPLVVWVLKGFIDDISQTIEEAALIDGCNYVEVFFKVTLPLAVPGMVAIAVLSFVFSWNEFIFALMFTAESTQTVPVALQKCISPAGTLWGKISASSMLGCVIPIIFILLIQKHLTRGLSLGAVKE